MNTDNYNVNDLNDYLLGKLSKEDTEKFDELGITDDEFAEALDAAERDLVDSYSNGELDEDDRALFEDRYSNSSSGRSLIRFSRGFQQFGADRSLSASAVAESKREARTATDGVFVSAIRYLRWGFAAAAVALLVFVGWMFFQGLGSGSDLADKPATPDPANANGAIHLPSNQQTDATQTPDPEMAVVPDKNEKLDPGKNSQSDLAQNSKTQDANTPTKARVFAFTLSPQLRSGGQLSVVSVPKNTERLTARLEIEPNDFNKFSVVLFDASNRQIWRSGSVHSVGSGDRKSVMASFPARLTNSGSYRFSVSGIRNQDPPENIGDYPFRVVQ